MNQDQPPISIPIGDLIAACAKEVSAHILAQARAAQLDPAVFLLNVATVLASSALAVQPEEQLAAASRHLKTALRLVHCPRDEEPAEQPPRQSFTPPSALQ